ncbi:MAG TPA: multidrug ABC transporter ATP-binding protein [Flavobacteriales bacterium]|nr:multidrug ABC transporter ATP-binding protein [Flavobacteriales bacterium]
MFDADKWQEIFAALGASKVRTALTALGVFWGIFMLIVMMGAGKGLENGVKKDFSNFATNSLFMWTQRTTKPFKGFPPGRSFSITNEDIEPLRRAFPEIEALSARCQLGGYRGESNVFYGTKSGPYEVYGDYPEIIEIAPRKLLEGRWLNELDQREKRKVAVIGTRVRDVLFGQEAAIGKYIRVQGVYFMVIGVFDLFSSANNSEREVERVFIPTSSFQQSFNYGNSVGWLNIMTKDEHLISDIEPGILKFLAERHDVDPNDARAFGSWNAEKEFVRISNLFVGIRFLIWVVGIGTLMAGVIGVSNIMLVVVKERTREIGVRKAIGATPYAITSQIVLEAVMLTSIAGYLGLLGGVYLIEGLNYFLVSAGVDAGMFENPEVDFSLVIRGSLVLIFAGGLAGLLPARRAAQVDPVIALRSE